MKHIRTMAYLGVGVYLLAGPFLQEADASIPEEDLELTLERALTLAQIQDSSLAQIEAELKAAGQETRDLGKWWPWARVPGKVENPIAGTGSISPSSFVSDSSESDIQTAFADLEVARSLALELLDEEAELIRQVKAFLSEESGAARPEIRRETQIKRRLIEFQIARLEAHYQYQLHLARLDQLNL